MQNEKSSKDSEIAIRELYPPFNDEQLKEAEENLVRYLEVVLRIYNRIRSDPEAYARLQSLTASRLDSNMDQ
jgi:hypothetical protein